MLTLLWLVPVLPLCGFLTSFLSAGRASKAAATLIGVGTSALSALLAVLIASTFVAEAPDSVYRQSLWRWMSVASFKPEIALQLDSLSLVVMLVVTCVGCLIHLYSSQYMREDPDYPRFMSYLNLFVAAMLVLVLADDLLLLYLGWEGVGLCSYLLIGFWYQDPANGRAARKAFVITRIGDTALAIGLLLLFSELGTLAIAPMLEQAQYRWTPGSPLATAASALLLLGAVGKSAQLPLHTWLPDAMAGPTPVSALIHAATMVTAGVYLIARTHALFELAPAVQLAVAVIGAATLLLAAVSALHQHDLKRILAYSTMSQVGYMFLALGVGAWTAAIFHLVTHAFFKALLFLAAGAVMMRIGDEHDIHRMGGLWRQLPLAFASFLIGAASLSALPLLTAGFYSKDMILWSAWNAAAGGRVLWIAGLVGAALTAMYSFRAVLIVFFGEVHTPVSGRSGWRIAVPLAVLSVLAIAGGWIETPAPLGHVQVLARLLDPVLPMPTEPAGSHDVQSMLIWLAAAVALSGVLIAYLRFAPQASAAAAHVPAASPVQRWWREGWGFDAFYDRLLVRPFLQLARANRNDFIDTLYSALAALARLSHAALSRSENGQLRRYASWLAAGALGAIALVVLA